MPKVTVSLLVVLSVSAHAQKVDSLRELLGKKSLHDSSKAIVMSQLAEQVLEQEGKEAVSSAEQGRFLLSSSLFCIVSTIFLTCVF